jgi:hypothetical protein
VLDRRNLHSIPLQTGRQAGIADAEGIGFQINRRLEVYPAEHHTRVRLRRTEHERHLDAGVETHAGSLDD